jgi:hypothetical protein
MSVRVGTSGGKVGVILAAAGIGLMAAVGCHQHVPEGPAVGPFIPQSEITAQPEQAVSVSTVSHVDSIVTTVSEPRVTIHLYKETDVRIPLRVIADVGGFSLLIPPEISRKVPPIDMDSVPVSMALRAILAAAGLGLAPTHPTVARLPFDTTVVFYQLPVNVDSLSAEAIMKRFSVSREIAELLVKSRKRQPGGG